MDIDQLPGIETRIQVMRDIKVMVDADLACRPSSIGNIQQRPGVLATACRVVRIWTPMILLL